MEKNLHRDGCVLITCLAAIAPARHADLKPLAMGNLTRGKVCRFLADLERELSAYVRDWNVLPIRPDC